MNTNTTLRILFATMLFASCTVAKVAVPDAFSSQAEELRVKGLQGFTFNQSLNFGPYITGEMKRGWDMSSKWQASQISFRPQDQLLRFFNIQTDNLRQTEKNKFQFAIRDGKLMADVFAFETFTERGKVYKSNSIFGEVSQTNYQHYDFSAAIVPYNYSHGQPWKLVMQSEYDRRKDTARNLLDQPYVNSTYYATDGKDSITIHPLYIKNVTTGSGKNTQLLGPPMLSGYELRIEDGVIGVIDILQPTVWMYKELDAPTKLVTAAIGATILLKRKQEVHNE